MSVNLTLPLSFFMALGFVLSHSFMCDSWDLSVPLETPGSPYCHPTSLLQKVYSGHLIRGSVLY